VRPREGRGGTRRRIPRAVFAFIVWTGCAQATAPAQLPGARQVDDSGAAYWPAAAWRAASPAALGMDTTQLAAMTRDIAAGRYGTVDGVIVVRFGWLGLERYFGWDAGTAHTLQSVTKSVTSLLYGIATAGGTNDAGRLDRPVLDVFARYPAVANDDARKRALTMRDLLTMRTSMDFWEQPYPGSPLDVLNRSTGDWTKYILDRPMVGDPGTVWAYNSGAAILVGSAIREITGESPDAFARHALFAPLGIMGERWFRSPYDGLPHTGGGLYLRPLDLARIGYLVLRHGAWNGLQVVPRAWIDSSTRAVSQGAPVYFDQFGSGYGWFWWTFPTQRGGTGEGVIAASGSGGQWLFVVPSLDLVVAIVATNGHGLDLLYDGVLPAVNPP
jgi:CubicO group peptidase (beta-lactamase class C family)